MHLFFRGAAPEGIGGIYGLAQRGQDRRARVSHGVIGCVLLLSLALAGCGASSATSARSAAQSHGDYLTDQNPAIDVTVEGLHVHSEGIHCGGGIVLATSRLSYDAAELQQMRGYFTSSAGSSSALPSTFKSVNVGVIQGFNTRGIIGSGCLADLQITNTGKSTVVITRAGVKLLAAPVRNAYQYHFVDTCTINGKPPEACQGGGYGSPVCGVEIAELRLAAKPAGTVAETSVIPGRDVVGHSCPAERPLQHGDSIEVLLHASGASAAANFAFSVVPVLTIRTSSGQHMVTIPRAESWIVLADPSQYTCYGLHGHAFTVESRGINAINRFGNLTGCV